MSHIDRHLTDKKLLKLKDYIADAFDDYLVDIRVRHGEITMEILRGNLLRVLFLLRDDQELLFKQLMDITAVDLLESKNKQKGPRFEVVYHLLSVRKNMRLRLKVAVADGAPMVSVGELFLSARWYEREVFDMFGIPFEGHPDLRRILTDYNFVGHPLRKDFPLEGHTEVYYDSDEQRVAYKPVDMPQKYRDFGKVSPWSGMSNNKDLADADNVFDPAEFSADAEG